MSIKNTLLNKKNTPKVRTKKNVSKVVLHITEIDINCRCSLRIPQKNWYLNLQVIIAQIQFVIFKYYY